VKLITSRDNPFFKDLKKLAASARQRRQTGRTLLDGVHLVRACMEAGKRPLHVLVNLAAMQDGEVAELTRTLPGVPLTQLDDSLFAELSELKTPTGILALIELPQTATNVAPGSFCLLLEDIQDPGNLGSMIRSAAAAGCDAVFLSQGCADAWSPKVLRGGMGGHFALVIHEAADLPAVAAAFAGEVYAASLQAKRSLYDCDLRGAVAFAIGNEGAGLSEKLLRAAHPAAIPMPGKVESLNAAAAAAVCLFEAARQRG
jgi:TrmH family RNA methyltransferase